MTHKCIQISQPNTALEQISGMIALGPV